MASLVLKNNVNTMISEGWRVVENPDLSDPQIKHAYKVGDSVLMEKSDSKSEPEKVSEKKLEKEGWFKKIIKGRKHARR